MMIRSPKKRWLAWLLACLLLCAYAPAQAEVISVVPSPSQTEEEPEADLPEIDEAAVSALENAVIQTEDAFSAPEQKEQSLLLQTIQHLKTVDWRELPQELRAFIDEISWRDLQDKIAHFDWRGALETLKSFFTETQWGEVGKEIERQFLLMYQEGAEGLQALGKTLESFSLDDFIATLQGAGESALQKAAGCAETARDKVESAVHGAADAAEDFAIHAKDAMESFAMNAKDAVESALLNAEDFARDAAFAVEDALRDAKDAAEDFAQNAADTVESAVQGTSNAITDWLRKLGID